MILCLLNKEIYYFNPLLKFLIVNNRIGDKDLLYFYIKNFIILVYS